MVGEFPELQGVMGRYYALHDGEDRLVADAIRDHYAPKGPGDAVPTAPVSIAVALADKLDQLAGFFAIGEKPTGAGDPYALRRAALGIIRIIRENRLRLHLLPLIEAGRAWAASPRRPSGAAARRSWTSSPSACASSCAPRARGTTSWPRCSPPGEHGPDDDLTRLLARTDAVAGAARPPDDGANLLTAYRRAANILRIEERKDGPHDGAARSRTAA